MNSQDPKPHNRVEPHRETFFEAHVRHDASTLRAELVSSLSGRPPSLRLTRTTHTGGSYQITFGPTYRGDLLDAVRQWHAIVDAHEAAGTPVAPSTSPGTTGTAIGVPGASSRNGGR